jgi:hypothetical protein
LNEVQKNSRFHCRVVDAVFLEHICQDSETPNR